MTTLRYNEEEEEEGEKRKNQKEITLHNFQICDKKFIFLPPQNSHRKKHKKNNFSSLLRQIFRSRRKVRN